MLKTIQDFFNRRIQSTLSDSDSTEKQSEHALQLATAALLIEVTRADFKVEESEQRMVKEAIHNAFDLTQEETEELLQLADEKVRESVSIYEFTHLIDRNFPLEKKKQIVEHLWRVAFSDENVDQEEELLIRRVAKLLHIFHEDFIDAKLRARDSIATPSTQE